MGQHKQALEIYVFKMQDYVKAEEYVYFISFIPNTVSTAPYFLSTIFDMIWAQQKSSQTLNYV